MLIRNELIRGTKSAAGSRSSSPQCYSPPPGSSKITPQPQHVVSRVNRMTRLAEGNGTPLFKSSNARTRQLALDAECTIGTWTPQVHRLFDSQICPPPPQGTAVYVAGIKKRMPLQERLRDVHIRTNAHIRPIGSQG